MAWKWAIVSSSIFPQSGCAPDWAPIDAGISTVSRSSKTLPVCFMGDSLPHDAAAGTHAVRLVGHLDPDDVVLAVSALDRRVANHVLMIQLFGDPLGGRAELGGAADDLGVAAALAGQLLQRVGIDARRVARIERIHADGIEKNVAAIEFLLQHRRRGVARRVGAVGHQHDSRALMLA